MLGIYELLNPTIAVELFAWTYRRSIRKYKVILEAMGSPDPFRVRHSDQISEAVQRIVREGQSFHHVTADIGLPADEANAFKAMLEAELKSLTPHNCARYRITLREAQAWIEGGRSL